MNHSAAVNICLRKKSGAWSQIHQVWFVGVCLRKDNFKNLGKGIWQDLWVCDLWLNLPCDTGVGLPVEVGWLCELFWVDIHRKLLEQQVVQALLVDEALGDERLYLIQLYLIWMVLIVLLPFPAIILSCQTWMVMIFGSTLLTRARAEAATVRLSSSWDATSR